MTWPAGVKTRIITFGSALSLVDGSALDLRLTVSPVLPDAVTTRELVWEATGEALIPVTTPLVAADGGVGITAMPCTDQTGFTDGNGNAVVPDTDGHAFLYKTWLTACQDGTAVFKSDPRVIALPRGDGSPVDYDTMIPVTGSLPGTTVALPDQWSAQIAALTELVQTQGIPTGASAGQVLGWDGTQLVWQDTGSGGGSGTPGDQGPQGVGVQSIADPNSTGTATVTLLDPKTGQTSTSLLPLPRGLQGDPGDDGVGQPGEDGHSPVLGWSGDQLTVDGTVSGPHLTGPAGADAFQVYPEGTDVSALPVGTIYGLYSSGVPSVRGFTSGHLTGTSFTIDTATRTGSAPVSGNTMLLLVGSSDDADGGSYIRHLAGPVGWRDVSSSSDMSPSGTIKPDIYIGTAAGSDVVTFTSSQSVILEYTLIWFNNASINPVIGTVKKRPTAPAETTTCTAPSIYVSAASLVIAVAWERSYAVESPDPTWDSAWTKLLYLPQNASDIASFMVATSTTSGSGNTPIGTATYSTTQANNGLGMQLGFSAAS